MFDSIIAKPAVICGALLIFALGVVSFVAVERGHQIETLNLKLAISTANEKSLQGAITEQNVKIEHLNKLSSDALLAAQDALWKARDQKAKADAIAAQLAAYNPSGATECERMLDADAEVLRSLK